MFVVLIPTYYLWTIIDAVKTAGRLSFEYHPKKYNRLIVYIGIFLMMATVVNVTSEVLKNYVIQAYKFPSTSMEPTVLVGDHILVDRREQAKERRRGDLIVFEYPKDETKDFMKRVVAIGGDTVEIRDKQLIVNGNPVTEAYVEYMDKLVMPANQSPRDNFGPITVPGNFYFVLGDNRDRSLDSRFFGVVEQSKVKGTVKTIYWSWDNQKCSVRWARVGKGVL
jgi:signal peptidase I